MIAMSDRATRSLCCYLSDRDIGLVARSIVADADALSISSTSDRSCDFEEYKACDSAAMSHRQQMEP